MNNDRPLARAYRAKRRAEIKRIRHEQRERKVFEAVLILSAAIIIHFLGETILALF